MEHDTTATRRRRTLGVLLPGLLVIGIAYDTFSQAMSTTVLIGALFAAAGAAVALRYLRSRLQDQSVSEDEAASAEVAA